MKLLRSLILVTSSIIPATVAAVPTNELPAINFNDLGNLMFKDTSSHEYYFSEGNTAFKAGNFDDAIKHYKKAIELNPLIPQIYFNLGLLYEDKGNMDEAIAAYKSAIEQKSDYAKAYRQIAPLARHKGLLDEAIEYYKKAVEYDPSYDDGFAEIARLFCEREKFKDAIPYFEKALKTKSGDLNLKFEYGNTLNTLNQCSEALEVYYQLLKIRPTDSSVLYNTAFTLKKMGRIEEAMPYYTATLKQRPDHAEAKFSRGLAYLLSGDFEKGWPDYEFRWQRGSQLEPREFRQPRWDGASLKGKTILIHSEQGLGDTFQFIRYAKTAKEKYEASTVIFAAQRALYTLVSRCCPYIDKVITLDQMSAVQFDVHCPLLSCPLVLKSDEKTMPTEIPYITPEPTLVEVWRRKLSSDPNFKVGICWQGNAQYSTAFLRAVVAAKSVPLKKFEPLFSVPGVSFYSLQRENGVDQTKGLSAKCTLKTFDDEFDKRFGRFMDTAALIKNLDLVITVDTSISHLAGAIGVPVWIMVPEPPDWRWMFKRTDTPWYLKNMRLFRQQVIGDWDGVITTIAQELSKFVGGKRSQAADFVCDSQPSCPRSCTTPCAPKVTPPALPVAAEPLKASRNESPTEQQLHKELANINKKLESVSKELKNADTSPDNEIFMKTMRSFLRLTEMRSEVMEKLKALAE